MNPVDLAFSPALEQARLIRDRIVSPLELVELYLARIERLNPILGSYFTVLTDRALTEARAKTDTLTRQDQAELPPFFGVPIAVKDLNPMADVRCTYGSRTLLDNTATFDDGVITRIKQAGFIILGKTATSELGSLPYTEPDGFPPARNPWNPDYTPGGSSGGSAAAVAAGLAAIAQGSDGGGSIRTPSFCCGLVGIKPSRGRITHAPRGDALSGLGINGPIARTVADAAALLDVLSGYVVGDPYWLPDPNPSFLEVARHTITKPLRIAYATTLPLVGDISPDCHQAVMTTVQRLEAMGHSIEVGCPDFTGLVEPFVGVWQSAVAAAGIPGEYLGPVNRFLLSRCGTAGDYLRSVTAMQVVARRIVGFFEAIDVLVLPTCMHTPIRVGEWADLPAEEVFQRVINWVAPCPPFNASGQPAITLPTGFTSEGVPVGVQLVGRPADESTLIALAAQLEQENPWPHRPTLAL
ncbi:MAG: amidase [Leptolyngbyaceae cyanobacterium bins.59]|nr:amidase [Leptolyngbyaceae cyanobacterium bins.59]